MKSEDQLADILTKVVTERVFIEALSKLSISDPLFNLRGNVRKEINQDLEEIMQSVFDQIVCNYCNYYCNYFISDCYNRIPNVQLKLEWKRIVSLPFDNHKHGKCAVGGANSHPFCLTKPYVQRVSNHLGPHPKHLLGPFSFLCMHKYILKVTIIPQQLYSE